MMTPLRLVSVVSRIKLEVLRPKKGKPMITYVLTNGSNGKAVNAEWVATFTLLDVSGSVTASQWRRFVAPLKPIWRRAVPMAG